MPRLFELPDHPGPFPWGHVVPSDSEAEGSFGFTHRELAGTYTGDRRMLPTVNALTGGGSALDGVVTAGAAVATGAVRDLLLGGTLSSYQLVSGSDAEAAPLVVRPDDYHASTNARVWRLLWTQAAPDRPYVAGTTLYGFGTSHEQGALASATAWAPGGIVPANLRWLNILAAATGQTLVNHGVSASRFSCDFGNDWGRRSHFNQLRLLPVNWTGTVICQGGYNDSYAEAGTPNWADVFAGVWDAWIARALLAGWVCPNGVRHDGTLDAFATTGTLTNEGQPEANSFHRGNPAADPRQVITLSGSQTATCEMPVNGIAVVFLGAAASGGGFGAGGTCSITVNGTEWARQSTVLITGSTTSEMPLAVVLRNVAAGDDIVITNLTGTTRVLALGWILPAAQATGRRVVVGTAPRFGSAARSDLLLAAIGRTALAAAQRWSDYQVYAYSLADVTAADAEPGDADHPSQGGNRHIARCALGAARIGPSLTPANAAESAFAGLAEVGARGSSPAKPYPWVYLSFNGRGYLDSWNGSGFTGLTIRATHTNFTQGPVGIGLPDGTTPDDLLFLAAAAGSGVSVAHTGNLDKDGNWVGARLLPGAGAGVSPGVLLRRWNGVGNEHCQSWFGADPTTTPADFVIRHGIATTANNDPTAVPELLRIRSDGRQVLGAGSSPLLRVRFNTAVLVGGTVTVPETAVTASSLIFAFCHTPGGAPGTLRCSARVANTSFTITSSSGSDTSTIAWMMVEP